MRVRKEISGQKNLRKKVAIDKNENRSKKMPRRYLKIPPLLCKLVNLTIVHSHVQDSPFFVMEIICFITVKYTTESSRHKTNN